MESLQQAIDEVLSKNCCHFVIDLYEAAHIDALTVKELMITAERCHNLGIKMTILIARDSTIEKILDITKTKSYFDYHYP